MHRSEPSCARASLAASLLLSLSVVIPTAHAELDGGYGVLIGKPTSYGLEPPNVGQWPHYKLKVQTPNGLYDVAVNLFSVSQNLGTAVAHREMFMDTSYTSYYSSVLSRPDGWHALPYHLQAGAATGGALDFQRHRGVVGDISDFAWQQTPLIVDADNNPNTQNAVPAFDQLLSKARRVYIWGEPYAAPQKGVHNVHQNQGNTTSFLAANGVWQDGGMVIEGDPLVINGVCVRWPCPFPIIIQNRILVITRFQVQADFTDAGGKGIANPAGPAIVNGNASNGWVHYGPFANARQLQVELSNVTGDPDVYSQTGAQPTSSTYSKRSSNSPGQPVFLRDYQPATGTLQYVSVYANGASSWTIKIRYAP